MKAKKTGRHTTLDQQSKYFYYSLITDKT